jgi:hypothetical protein
MERMLRKLRANAEGTTESGKSGRKRLSRTVRKASSGEEWSLVPAGGNPKCESLFVEDDEVEDDKEEVGGVRSWGALTSLTRTVPPGRRTRAASSARSFLCNIIRLKS